MQKLFSPECHGHAQKLGNREILKLVESQRNALAVPSNPHLDPRLQADAVLHFGTHGSLEFMPGKQVGMSDICYPDSLIGSIPNLYYYAANNPSEATIAKRRSYANTISYLTPPAENAGLYKGLKVGALA